MHIHEYQAKKILSHYNINIPKSQLVTHISQIPEACQNIGGNIWLVKAQAHTGSRGKGGGVVLCKSISEVQNNAQRILSQRLITPQTDAKGLPVNEVLIEQGIVIDKEVYLSILIDRSHQQIGIIASSEGGADIEKLATLSPDKIIKQLINITNGLSVSVADNIALKLGLEALNFSSLLLKLYDIFIDKNLVLIEINPLVVSTDNLVALDCKMEFDNNAMFKNKTIKDLRDTRQENDKELEASKYGLNYISLDGDIGCMVNGAGLAMATMDLIGYYGGNPLNFLDVSGGTSSDKVAIAFELIQSEAGIKAILVNIFGGIVRCDLIADGILQAINKVGLNAPLVVRLEGLNAEQGLILLAESKYNIISVNDLTTAAKKVVEISQL